MRFPTMLIITATITAIMGLPAAHANDVVDQLQRALGNGTSDSYERGREDQARQQALERERRQEQQQQRYGDDRQQQRYGDDRQRYGTDRPYDAYPQRQQRGS